MPNAECPEHNDLPWAFRIRHASFAQGCQRPPAGHLDRALVIGMEAASTGRVGNGLRMAPENGSILRAASRATHPLDGFQQPQQEGMNQKLERMRPQLFLKPDI
jgi:hypothetical protein